MQRTNIYAGAYLDRAAHLRADTEWLAAALRDDRTRVAPGWNLRSFVTDGAEPRALFIDIRDVPDAHRTVEELIFLGLYEGLNVFAYEFQTVEPPPLRAAARFEDLRSLASQLPAEEAGLLGYARALFSWRRRNRFCGTCGSATLPVKGGHVLMCTNAACRHEHFPRLDPAIIVLISDGSRALLGRQASWPAGRYSTIAGFVEPGESFEDAVAREVLEETGVAVDSIEYHSSQPWPFPASLMIGFTAHATTHEVKPRDHELEDVQWFTRADIAAGTPLLPPSQSISFRLIEHWFDADGAHSLSQLREESSWPRSP